jgi:hypothetical protein
MSGRIRWTVATTLVLLASIVVGGGSPTTASGVLPSPSTRAIQPAATSTIEPDDPSGFTFRAFRSFGLGFAPGLPFYLQVSTSGPAGQVDLYEVIGDTEVFLASPTWAYGGTVNGVERFEATWLDADGTTEGMHRYLARLAATDETDEVTLTLDLDVQRAVLELSIDASANPVQTNHEVTLSGTRSGGVGADITGTIEWRNADTGAVLGTSSAAGDWTLTFASLPVSTHRFVLAYSGNSVYAPVTSSVYTLTVVADAIDATGVGVQYTTFYPVKDGYRDTVAVKGTRAEPISVAIRIYSSNGTRVRSASIAKGTGAYSYAWNGRTSTGTILASGTYKVVQTLTDERGTKKAFTSYVTLSKKKLVTYTKYVTKAGSAVSAKGKGGTGSVTLSTSGGYAKLSAGTGGGWALAGWEFTLPSATVYTSVSFQVYAKAPLSVPPTEIGMQNFTTCARTSGDWYDTCFGRWASVGNSTKSLAWFRTSGTSSSAYRSGRYVRGLIAVGHGTVYVYKARAKVVYQVLE